MTEQEIMVIEGIGAVECGGRVEIRRQRGPLPEFLKPVDDARDAEMLRAFEAEKARLWAEVLSRRTAEVVIRLLCDLPQAEQDRAEEALREWLTERSQVRARWREMKGLDAFAGAARFWRGR